MPEVEPTLGMPTGNITPFGPNEEGIEAPIYPVKQGNEVVPKFQLDQTGKVGELLVEPKDLEGTFDYIPDVESMSITKSSQSRMKLFALNLLQNPLILQTLQQEGYKPKMHDLLVEMFEDSGFRDARRFFEEAPAQSQLQQPNLPDGSQVMQEGAFNGQRQASQGQVNPGGGGSPVPGIPPSGNGGDQRLLGGAESRAGEQNQAGAI